MRHLLLFCLCSLALLAFLLLYADRISFLCCSRKQITASRETMSQLPVEEERSQVTRPLVWLRSAA